MGVIKTLNRTGHGELKFDPLIAAEVEAARKQVEEAQANGLLLLVIDKPGGAARSSRSFDPSAAEHILLRQLVGG